MLEISQKLPTMCMNYWIVFHRSRAIIFAPRLINSVSVCIHSTATILSNSNEFITHCKLMRPEIMVQFRVINENTNEHVHRMRRTTSKQQQVEEQKETEK